MTPTLLVVRGVAVAALLSAFGALAFGAGVLPRALAKAPEELASTARRRVRRVARFSLAAALVALPGWAALQAAVLLPPASLGETLAALPGVLVDVRFGQFALAGAAACALALVALHRFRWRLATGLAALAVTSHAGHLHGFAMQGIGPLAGVETVHLLAAGAWLGGLVPLLVVVATAPPAVGAAACRWFSPLGKVCVVATAASAVWQGWMLVGGLAALVDTGYGRIVLVKTALFGVLFGFAWLNRYRLAPALTGIRPAAARRALLTSLALQTGTGLLTVAVAVALSSQQPATDQQTTGAGGFASVRVAGDISRVSTGAAPAAVFAAPGSCVEPMETTPMIRLLVLAFALAAPLAQAQTTPTGGVSVDHPWARATAAGAPTGAAYLTLRAHGTSDRLIGASTPVAGMAELHRTIMGHGVMHMRPVPDGLPLPANQPVTFAPSGLHVMLMQLKHPLKQGETFPLTLTFAHAAPVTVQVPVSAAGASGPEVHPIQNGHGDMPMGTMKP